MKTASRVTWTLAEPFPVNQKHSSYTLFQEGKSFCKRAEKKTFRTRISVAGPDNARVLTTPRSQQPALDEMGFLLPASLKAFWTQRYNQLLRAQF